MSRISHVLLLCLSAALMACQGGRELTGADGVNSREIEEPLVHRICPGPDAQKEALRAFFEAEAGEVIEFCAGDFRFSTSLIMTGKRGITIRGAGPDKTILSFADSPAQDGISLNQVNGMTLEDLTIMDAPGNGLRIFRAEDVTVRRVHVGWSNADPTSPQYDASMESWKQNGAYAFYPVFCNRLLIEDSVAFGSSDSGFYVGQTRNALVRRNLAFHNVIGFEFENTYYSEFVENEARDNTAGMSLFDLPSRIYTGAFNSAHHNKIHNNNIPNFAPIGTVAAFNPQGTGMLVFASDLIRIYENEISNNNTIGIALFNYGVVSPNEAATQLDFYPEGVEIFDNLLRDNGQQPALPNPELSACIGTDGLPGGLPGLQDSPDCVVDNPSLIPLLIQLKNYGKGVQILWDGARDLGPNDCSIVPADRYGVPLDQPNPLETDRGMPRVDFRGRPNFYQFDPRPACRWNAWKFDDGGTLKLPENGVCIRNNRYESTSPLGLRVDDYAQLNMRTADVTPEVLLTPTTYEPPQDCPTVPARYEGAFTPELPRPLDISAESGRVDPTEVARLCAAGRPGQRNQAAIAQVNCPLLSDYGLFEEPTDPRSRPVGAASAYALNTELFTDYAVKHRFIFLPAGPDGRAQTIGYQDPDDCLTLTNFDCRGATLKFPVGTVLAKTFSFPDGEAVDVVETRLLIKRARPDGRVFWVGLPYRWQTSEKGKPEAVLKIEGDTVAVSWNYADAQGVSRSGSTDSYAVPNAGACLQCHGGDDLEAGAAPIGPKVRNLNRDADYLGLGSVNQLSYLQMQGWLNLPDSPEQLRRLPRWDVPGDSGELPDSPADVHDRALAYLEVNCMHCHKPGGNAENSGLRLDAFEKVLGQPQGICKVPIAAGKAAEFGRYDIEPGAADASILPGRVATTQPGAMMPPVGRSQAHAEAVALLHQWVDTVVPDFVDPDANFCGQSGFGLPLR